MPLLVDFLQLDDSCRKWLEELFDKFDSFLRISDRVVRPEEGVTDSANRG